MTSCAAVHVAESFANCGVSIRRGLEKCSAKRREEVPDLDPYGDDFDFGSELNGDSSVIDALMKDWSLEEPKAKDGSLATTKKSKLDNKPIPWENWDPFMEEEFGDMDRILTDDEEWVYELRDIVELKRGMAIWSRRTGKELNAERQKALRDKVVYVPPNFERIITCVFLEKTHTMKQMRAENELAVIEFRKWMLKNRKRLKKNPLPVVKIEVSKKWLTNHPAAGLRSRGVYSKPPEVVMDELRLPNKHVQFEPRSTSSPPSSSKMSMFAPGGTDASPDAPANTPNVNSGSTITSGNTSSGLGSEKKGALGRVTTASMINWEMSASELPEQMTSTPMSVSSAQPTLPQFQIDEVDILVATEGGYFVVL